MLEFKSYRRFYIENGRNPVFDNLFQFQAQRACCLYNGNQGPGFGNSGGERPSVGTGGGVSIYIYMYICICICICVYIYIHVGTFISVYTHVAVILATFHLEMPGVLALLFQLLRP